MIEILQTLRGKWWFALCPWCGREFWICLSSRMVRGGFQCGDTSR
jgi:phage terminase large subunit GpA-like protein